MERKFKLSYKNTDQIVTAILCLSAVPLILALIFKVSDPVAVVCIVLCLAMLVTAGVIHKTYWKCPSCGQRLARKRPSGPPAKCEKCGKKLEW